MCLCECTRCTLTMSPIAPNQAEMRAMVEIHREIARSEGGVEPFNEEEENMIKGALSLSVRTVAENEQFKPVDRTFKLPIDGHMDYITMNAIVQSGFSRIPVHAPGDESLLLGYIISKDHILLDPKERRPISTLPLYQPVLALPSTTLATLLNEFQTGRSHFAFVSKNPDLLKRTVSEYLLNRDSAVVSKVSKLFLTWIGVCPTREFVNLSIMCVCCVLCAVCCVNFVLCVRWVFRDSVRFR